MKQRKPKTDSAAAAEVDALKDSGREMEGLKPVGVTVAKEPRAVVSLRLTPAELARFSSAASDRGMTFSDFMRAAATAAAAGDVDVSQTAAISEIQQKAQELVEAAGKLRAS